MKIAYLLDDDIYTVSGVMQKILQQTSKWLEMGHSIYFVSSKSLTIYSSDKKVIYQLKHFEINLGRFGTALKLLHSSYYLEKLLQNIQFDILYMRYRLYMPFFAKVLKKHKVIMEINGNDILEYRLYSILTHIYNKYTRNLFLKHIDGFVSVSHELKNIIECFGKKIEVISNGINALEYDMVNYQNKSPNLVFIGTPNQPWQGIDKIIKLASYFENYYFLLIGTEGENTKNLKYYGYLSQNDSTKIIQKCDIGIGTLSSYVNGLEEASPLKTRQYLACGLPLIYAYDDTDLIGNEPYTLKLKNCEDNINYEEIKLFIERVFNNRALKSAAREFAVNQLDYKLKEKKRLEFFQKVLDEK